MPTTENFCKNPCHLAYDDLRFGKSYADQVKKFPLRITIDLKVCGRETTIT